MEGREGRERGEKGKLSSQKKIFVWPRPCLRERIIRIVVCSVAYGTTLIVHNGAHTRVGLVLICFCCPLGLVSSLLS